MLAVDLVEPLGNSLIEGDCNILITLVVKTKRRGGRGGGEALILDGGCLKKKKKRQEKGEGVALCIKEGSP